MMARAPWRRGTGASRLMQDLADATVNDVDTRNDTTAAPVMASTAAAPGPVPSHSSTATTAATAASDGSALRVPKKTPSIGRLATSLFKPRAASFHCCKSVTTTAGSRDAARATHSSSSGLKRTLSCDQIFSSLASVNAGVEEQHGGGGGAGGCVGNRGDGDGIGGDWSGQATTL